MSAPTEHELWAIVDRAMADPSLLRVELIDEFGKERYSVSLTGKELLCAMPFLLNKLAEAERHASDFAERLFKIGTVPALPHDAEHVDFAKIVVPKGIIVESTKLAHEYREELRARKP